MIDLHGDYLRCRGKSDAERWHAALLRGWMEGSSCQGGRCIVVGRSMTTGRDPPPDHDIPEIPTAPPPSHEVCDHPTAKHQTHVSWVLKRTTSGFKLDHFRTRSEDFAEMPVLSFLPRGPQRIPTGSLGTLKGSCAIAKRSSQDP